MGELPAPAIVEPHPAARAYEAYSALLFFIARREYGVPPDDVEALVNDVFVGYLRHYERLQNEKAWLARAMRNVCAEYWRTHGRTAQICDETDPVAISDDAWNARVDLVRVLRELPDRCRQALEWHYYRGFALEEVAVRLRTSLTNTKQILFRCRNAARALFLKRRSGK